MPLISFSVFKEKILSERKTQTMRKPRKRPIKVGDTLYLWWKSRSKHEGEYIGRAICTEVRRVTLSDVWDDEKNAKADGFDSLKEFRDWFAGKGWEDEDAEVLKWFLEDEEYDIIKWKLPNGFQQYRRTKVF